MFRKIMIPLMAGTALSLSACADAADQAADGDSAMADASSVEEATPDIVGVASGNADFSTLVAAVQAAGLVETLQGDGPFTVFAPNNAAFDALPEGTVETLTTEETGMLGSILTYHVVAGELMAADVLSAIEAAGDEGLAVETVNGGTLTATLVDGSVVLTDANGGTATVIATDVDASNGVIHVIDTVLMPA
ncbi:fasciclin domain-containing protein [Aurantiacibacter gilvus]|uniref:Fasciclin domain-containing protein n=1 Tax=Aurantiacibacter gilvus TaxID=3139141 RepID=A0ABU9IFP8_9SPHN